MKPIIGRFQGKHAWERWVVALWGKKPVWFEHWYAAAIFAVYVARNPVAMEDAV